MKTIDHVALLVDDLDVAQAWYEDKLEAICEYSTDSYRRMRFNNSTVALISNTVILMLTSEFLRNVRKIYPNMEKEWSTVMEQLVYILLIRMGNCIEHIWYNEDCKKKVRNED